MLIQQLTTAKAKCGDNKHFITAFWSWYLTGNMRVVGWALAPPTLVSNTILEKLSPAKKKCLVQIYFSFPHLMARNREIFLWPRGCLTFSFTLPLTETQFKWGFEWCAPVLWVQSQAMSAIFYFRLQKNQKGTLSKVKCNLQSYESIAGVNTALDYYYNKLVGKKQHLVVHFVSFSLRETPLATYLFQRMLIGITFESMM